MAGVEQIKVGDDEAGMRLDRWFKAHFPGLGFGHLQKLLRSGQIRVDGGRAKADTRVEPGQVLVRVKAFGLNRSELHFRQGVASSGTFPTHGPLFVTLLVAVILILGGLTFFPALALGPIAEHVSMLAVRTF